MKKYLITLFLASTFLSFSTWGQKKLSKAQTEQIDKLFETWSFESTPGAAVGVVKNGALIFSKGFGMASLQHKVPFKTNTVADIGSVAKQFTSFAIALLAEEGKLSLDDDIHKFFPELPDFGHKVTIRHLVHHTSGLREVYGANALRGWSPGIRQEDIFHLLKNQRELNFKPGDRYLYCNTSYALLGAIIEKASGGHSFEEFFQERVFGPLGMNNTYIMDHLGEIFPNGADSYRPVLGGFREVYDNSSMFGQGGFYSNVEDMAKWLANFQNPKVGNENVMKQILQTGTLNNGEKLIYAFGLNVSEHRGAKIVSHGGASAGFRTWLSWFPDHQLGIIIQSNRSDAGRLDAMNKMVEIVLGDQLEPISEDPDEPEKKEKKTNQTYSQEELKKFTGSYYSPELESVYTIFMEEEDLKVKVFRSEATTMNARPEKDNFSTRGMQFQFERDDTGRVISFRVSNGRVLNLKFFRASLPSF